MTHRTSDQQSSFNSNQIIHLSRKVVKEFLTLYREKECLWNKKSYSYKDKRLRGQAVHELLLVLQKDFPAATVSDVKRKIENFRTIYRRQLRNWIKSSAPDYDGQVIEPSIWYFPLLTFLDVDEIPDLAGYQINTENSADDKNEVNEKGANNNDTDNDENFDVESDATGDDALIALSHFESRQRRVMRKVLLLYQKHPCLWKLSHPHYTSKEARKAAWDVLIKAYKKYDKYINLDRLKKKIENYRTTYRRQLKRMIEGISKGVCEYPSLWYFNLLFFMDKYKYPDIEYTFRDELNADVDMSGDQSRVYVEEWIDEDSYKDEHDVDPAPADTDDENPIDSPYVEAFSKSKSEQTSTQETLKNQKFEQSMSKENSEANPYVESRKRIGEKDRFDIAGENIACKLRFLDVEQRIRAEKLINDVLFYAEMKNLDDQTDLIVSKTKLKNE